MTSKVKTFRIAMIGAGTLLFLLLLSPTVVLHSDAYAQPTSAPVVKVTSPKVTLTAPTTTLTATPVDAKIVPAPTAPVEKKADNQQKWWQALLMPVLSALGLIIAAFLTIGMRKVTQLIEAKWKIDISESNEKAMAEKARWLVAWAEEQAEARLLNGDGIKTPGAEKLSAVVDTLFAFADKAGYGEDWTRDKITKLAEGILHLERDAGIGSEGTARGSDLTVKAANQPTSIDEVDTAPGKDAAKESDKE